MAYLSACWKIAGYSLVTTRVAMLVIAAVSLTGLVRLAEVVANRQVAIATAVCTAIYPVFFVQSSLAQVDLAAAGFTFWGLHAYIQNRPWAIGFWMSLAALTKETAILAPVALVAWELLSVCLRQRPMATHGKRFEESWATTSGSHRTVHHSCRVVCLSLSDDRLPARESRILPIQRAVHIEPSAGCRRARPSFVADLRVLASLDSQRRHGACHVSPRPQRRA